MFHTYTVAIILILSIIQIKSEISLTKKISNVREKVLSHCNSNPDKVHPLDVQHVQVADHFIKRYLLDQENDIDGATNAIIETLEFFKSENLHQYNDTYFPSEFYSTGSFYIFGKSKLGQPLIGVVPRCLYPFADISDDLYELALKHFYYNAHKMEFMVDSKGVVVYAALNGMGLSNIEFGMVKQLIVMVNKHAPRTPSELILLDLGFFIKMSVNILIQLLNDYVREHIHFEQLSEVEQWVSRSQMPTHAGGYNTSFVRIPPGVKSGKCLPHLKHIPEDVWDQFREQNSVCIHEGMAEIGVQSIDEYLRSC